MSDQIFCMDGTSAILDLISGASFTMTGTPTTAPLLGAIAPKISATEYTSCKISTPFAAGDPITIMIACQSTWAGNDSAFHWLFETASGSQRIIVQKTNLNNLRVYTKDAAGNTKTKSVPLYAGTWLANVPHIIIITLDAANNQRIWLDGVEGLASTGAGVRESAVGAYSYFGSDSTGAYPATAAILAAIYGEVKTDVSTTGEGIVTFTFDNGLASQYTDALPVLAAQGVDATFYILPGYLGTGAYMTAAQVQDIYALGHEIGSHTWSHADLPGLTPAQLTDELSDSKDWIETNVGPCYSFSSPNGLYNDAVLTAIKLYYDSHRTADDGRNSVFGFDPFLLKIHFVQNTTTPADVAAWISEAAATKQWLILVYHSIGNLGTPNYCTAVDLNAHLISAKTSGLPVLTVNDGLTVYETLVDDSGIGALSRLTSWRALWASLITVHKDEKKSAYVSILDPAGATPLARLTEHFPTTGWTPDIFENLSFESVNRGGYTVASFTIHRPVTQFWADLQYRNQVIIGRGSEIYWEGYISKPIRSIRPDVIEVNCLGWSAELNQLWTAADITAPVGGYKMSTFINTVLLADPYTHLVAGTIETGDYAYPEGTVFAFAPNKYYADALEELDAGNNFNWGVWGNKAIDLRAKHASVDWLVWTGDCEDLTISPNPDGLCNYVMANFTQDGTHDEQVIVQDAGVGSSQEKYGAVIMQRVDIPGKVDESSGGAGIPGGATHIAEVYLAEHKDLKVAAEFTCSRIFDAYGAEQYLGKVEGGEVVRIVDWLPTEETLGSVNDIATFEIKSPKYDHDNDTLAITPTEFLPSTEIQIARLQATGY